MKKTALLALLYGGRKWDQEGLKLFANFFSLYTEFAIELQCNDFSVSDKAMSSYFDLCAWNADRETEELNKSLFADTSSYQTSTQVSVVCGI